MLIRLGMRRFLCTNPACRAVTFAGQADGLTARYQRRSVPLARLLSQLALNLAGRAGARLAKALGITIHRSTLLRLVMTLPDPAASAAPEVIGVDDFARHRPRWASCPASSTGEEPAATRSADGVPARQGHRASAGDA